jgi:hypothetical protein
MRSDETFATLNGIKKRLLAFGCHWGILVGPSLGQYPGRVKMKGVELSQILRLEQTAILGKRVFDILFRPPLLQEFFGEARLSIVLLDDTMFESGGFGEEKHLSLFFRSVSPEPGGKASESQRSQAGAHKHFTAI